MDDKNEKYEELLKQVSEIVIRLDNYDYGNAMELVEINESLKTLAALLLASELKGFNEAAIELERMYRLVPKNELRLIPLFKEFVTLMIKDECQSDRIIKPWILDSRKKLDELENEKRRAEEKAEQQNAMLYEEGFFDSVIEDKKLLKQFLTEAQEHMDEAQSILIEVEYDQTNQELLNTLFRNFHTIKGSSAFLGLKNIENLSHSMEDLLALVREGNIILVKELINTIFTGIDLLKTILSTMVINDFEKSDMVESFKLVNIFPFIALMRRIIEEYKYKKIGEILEEEGKLTKEDVGYLVKKQKESDKMFGELAVDEKIVTNDDLLDAIKKQKEQSSRLKKTGFVKVSNEKLNTLIDIVGELVINQSMLKQELITATNNDNIDRSMGQLEAITTTIKNLVLSMGMVPIADIFNKLRVVARNTANELDKSVFVEMHGEETELDRNVIETIYDPLMHLVRNAIDHGIESPADRVKSGKDKVGKVLMQADHKGSGIEIIIKDDGKGIDRNAMLKKALNMKLVKEDEIEKLTDREIFAFLFEPGFSTSAKVTKISGRGVGLDVVKKNVESIHGRVDVSSELGKYTKFTIKLPLSLAIIEGFVTRIGRNKYIFPFTSIEEINVFSRDEFIFSEGGDEVIIYYQNVHIPVISPHRLLSEEKINSLDEGQELCLLFSIEHTRYCVVVDEIIGKQEIVIKTLSGILQDSRRYLSGGTIFGDGSIGFVIEMQGFVDALQGNYGGKE